MFPEATSTNISLLSEPVTWLLRKFHINYLQDSIWDTMLTPLPSDPLHVSTSYMGRPHYTLKAFNSADALVCVLHVGEYGGGGEWFPPDANTLEKR
jgi:hypothetical protein